MRPRVHQVVQLTPADRELVRRIQARADAEAEPRVELGRLAPLRLRQDRDELLRMLRQ
jgi:hypothetical protein